jgi:hypothetical protein
MQQQYQVRNQAKFFQNKVNNKLIQFNKPTSVCFFSPPLNLNNNNEFNNQQIIVTDTNNHRLQSFTK